MSVNSAKSPSPSARKLAAALRDADKFNGRKKNRATCRPDPSSTYSSDAQAVRKARLLDVNSGLIASKELLKAITRLNGPDDATSSLIAAVTVELDRARRHVDRMMEDLQAAEEESATWREKMLLEIDRERKLRKQMEFVNRKLGAELAGVKSRLETKELEIYLKKIKFGENKSDDDEDLHSIELRE